MKISKRWIYSGLVMIVALAASTLLFSRQAQADDFLKFHWKFDEGTGTTAADSSGNTPSYPGTLFNGPAWLPAEDALRFDGINDYARTNSALPNSMGVPNQAYTLSASVRVAAGETEGNIIHISNGANGIGWCISMLHITGGKFRAIGWQNSQGVVATDPTNAVPGEWYSIANTWSPETDELRLYVNGALVAATPMTSYMAANENVYVFAGIDSGGCANNTGWFKGDVKDVRIYNREISQEEAQDNTNESLGIPSIAINAPVATSNIKTWSPSVDWSDANECFFSANNTDWTTADCSLAGADIPAPTTNGINKHLYVRSNYTGEASSATANATFAYDTVNPTVNAGDNQHTGSLPFTQSTATATDATSGVASYTWSKQSGPGAVTFSNTHVLNPNVTAVSQNGTYVLRLTVTDTAGNSSYDDMTLIWDSTNPDVELTSFPDEITNQTQATFAFTGTDSLSSPVSYQCKLDAGSFTSCISPTVYSNLTAGDHTFIVRASDSVSNIADDVSYTWTVVADQSNDKNGDGIPDDNQQNVSTSTSPTTNHNLVLETDGECDVDESTVKTERINAAQDPLYDYPEGLFNFTLNCDETGSSTTIKQYYYGVAGTNLLLRKYNPNTKQYFTISNATVATQTVYGEQVTVATYIVQDGGALDMDGQANGVIVDPAGLAIAVPNLAGTGQSTKWYVYAIATLFIAGGATIAFIKFGHQHQYKQRPRT